ncbi:MAG: hypothetical protein DCC58_00705 [Chloroflexi bacterium]|nr:MAG: hypothetical protein DCC58_00705 [Chloroflexota bacterium]
MRRAMPGETTLRVVLAVALFSGLLGIASWTQNTSAAPVSLTRSVAASSDDARYSDANAYSGNEQVALVGAGNGSRANVSGYRFTGITIPQGAKIISVEFSLVKATTQYSRMVTTYGFQAVGNAPTFSSSAHPASRVMTSARFTQDDNIRRLNGQRYVMVSGSALVASLQEVVNRPDWVSGNSIVLLASGPAQPAWARQNFRTVDSGTANAPRLTITYELTAAQPNPTATSTLTNTPVPPTATATNTPVPPTATNTPTTSAPATGYGVNIPWDSKPSWTQPAGMPTPVAGQPCPVWVHDRYAVQANDGKWYPTWHPTTDPEFGCFFGHEHGDNPNGAGALGTWNVPFGYVGAGIGHLEAHPGYKIFRWDNVQSPYNAPSHNGAQLLMMVHQGTSNNNAFTEARHEVHFHYKNPNDGREVHVQMMAVFGELRVGCGANDPNMDIIQKQFNGPGARVIPSQRCFTAPNIPYEDWITALYVGSDAQGNWRAYLDPHFAVFDPNRFCLVQNGACTLGRSDTQAGTGADPAGAGAWFKGVKREAYLNQVWLDNQGNSPIFYTDAFGKLVPSNTPGAFMQYVAAMDSRLQVNSTAFGSNRDNDPDDNVHAPN